MAPRANLRALAAALLFFGGALLLILSVTALCLVTDTIFWKIIEFFLIFLTVAVALQIRRNSASYIWRTDPHRNAPITVELTPDAFVYDSAYLRAVVRWPAVTYTTCRTSHVILYDGTFVYGIPLRVFTSPEQSQAFQNFIAQHVDKKDDASNCK